MYENLVIWQLILVNELFIDALSEMCKLNYSLPGRTPPCPSSWSWPCTWQHPAQSWIGSGASSSPHTLRWWMPRSSWIWGCQRHHPPSSDSLSWCNVDCCQYCDNCQFPTARFYNVSLVRFPLACLALAAQATRTNTLMLCQLWTFMQLAVGKFRWYAELFKSTKGSFFFRIFKFCLVYKFWILILVQTLGRSEDLGKFAKHLSPEWRCK